MERVSAPVLRLAAADRALHGRRILVREIPRIHEPAEIIQRFGFDHTVLHIEFLLADVQVAAHQVPEFAAQDEGVGLAVGAVHAGQVMPVLSGEFGVGLFYGFSAVHGQLQGYDEELVRGMAVDHMKNVFAGFEHISLLQAFCTVKSEKNQ